MIFVTVGTQLPFDRLVDAMDRWASARGRSDVFAQIGPSKLQPKHIQWQTFLDTEECRSQMERASIVVAHAGTGTILTALELGKRLLVMPRRSALREHRNDHQVATAKQLGERGHVVVVFDEDDLVKQLDAADQIRLGNRISATATPELVSFIRSFIQIDGGAAARRKAVPALLASIPKTEQTVDSPDKKVVPFAQDVNGSPSTVSQRTSPVRHDSHSQALHRTRALVVLTGSLHINSLEAKTGRSVLDLPLRSGYSLLDAWREQFVDLRDSLAPDARFRIVGAYGSPLPPLKAEDEASRVSTERDLHEFRGTGGVIRDIAADYQDDEYLLLALGAQYPLKPLREIAAQLASLGGEVNMLAQPSDLNCGVFLVRCSALRSIRETGFVDFKEQALPAIAGKHLVRVRKVDKQMVLPMRTLSDYVNIVEICATPNPEDRILHANPFAEKWRPHPAVVENGAWMDPSARVHSSVILSGARLEANAVVARSVVCCGAVVPSGRRIVKELVSAGGGD